MFKCPTCGESLLSITPLENADINCVWNCSCSSCGTYETYMGFHSAESCYEFMYSYNYTTSLESGSEET